MAPTIRSVNVGRHEVLAGGKGIPTGITKQPVGWADVTGPGTKRLGPEGTGHSGFAGDFIGDGRHHGGSDQAVYAFAREEMDWWEQELGRQIPDGLFGENLTTAGLDVDAAEIGDRWRVGSAALRVTGPRVPCVTFAARTKERGWVRRFADRGRSGAYLAVEVPGRIAVGDRVDVEASRSGIPVPLSLRAWLGDPAAARLLLAAGVHEGAEWDHLARVAGPSS